MLPEEDATRLDWITENALRLSEQRLGFEGRLIRSVLETSRQPRLRDPDEGKLTERKRSRP
jgi:hypothetical protein